MPYTVTCRTSDGVEHTFDLPYANSCPIYNYHPDFKYFTCKTEAQKDPLEHNMYLAPRGATCVEVPEPELGKVRVFDEENQVWKQVDDVSGIWFSTDPDTLGQQVVIENPVEDLSQRSLTRHNPCFVPENNMLVWNGEPSEDATAFQLSSASSECGWSFSPVSPATPQEKLKNLGLSVEDLRVLLDL